MPTSAEFRARARESLSGNWTSAVLHYLLFSFVMSALGSIGFIPLLGWIPAFLCAGAMIYGLMAFFLDLSRRQSPATETLFSGFPKFGETFVLYLLMLIFVWLWSLLLIIPGIIAAFRYSQAYFILKDNPGIGALEAIRRSKEMMAGNKGRLFFLMLSFIGWALLVPFTLGIGALWLVPYVYTSVAHFHNDLLMRTASVPPPPPPPQSYYQG
ncbi:putative membrane protein [Cohnella sp. SGD-V74]|uniref:DUF975 family protein n=1 Tax=unclassified Cohnella TaxID=2636738 RepID=UPI000D41E471|nr:MULTISPECIES: DUF975 family protein [unclassified Cohnella]PRX71812.1 putative membrane protein [Cohnella sp. SGD-V74]